MIKKGMKYPENVNTAKEVERIIRENGAIPATIALINQRIYVGLTDEQKEILAKNSPIAIKLSRRDLANLLVTPHRFGGTTVSATMIIADRVGISIFVTGGIGGVHIDGENSLDISADLRELGRTPVTVISAGIKSILDIPRTLEYLETEGVTVMSFQSNFFPAFFTANSGIKSPLIGYNIDHVANVIMANHLLELQSGILLAVPIPQEFSADGKLIEDAIQKAIKESNEKNIKGKEVTPFLLKRVAEITNGTSLLANIHLIKNNAKIGAQLAVSFAKLKEIVNNISVDYVDDPSQYFYTNIPLFVPDKIFEMVGEGAIPPHFPPNLPIPKEIP